MNYLITGVDEGTGEVREIETDATDEQHAIELARKYGIHDPKVAGSAPPVLIEIPKLVESLSESSNRPELDAARKKGTGGSAGGIAFLATLAVLLAAFFLYALYEQKMMPHWIERDLERSHQKRLQEVAASIAESNKRLDDELRLRMADSEGWNEVTRDTFDKIQIGDYSATVASLISIGEIVEQSAFGKVREYRNGYRDDYTRKIVVTYDNNDLVVKKEWVER